MSEATSPPAAVPQQEHPQGKCNIDDELAEDVNCEDVAHP